MHEWAHDLLRIGQQLRGEWGGLLTLAASLLIVAAAAGRLLARVGRGVAGCWRWTRGTSRPAEDDTPEGA